MFSVFFILVGNITSLKYQPIFRPPHKDWGFEFGSETTLDIRQHQFKLEAEFIRVLLSTSHGKTHEEYHAHVVARSPPQEHRKDSGLPLSVVIIGIDSLSAAHFRRALPEAYKFMTEEMNSVFLNGYSIVGDGTTPALTALLTGWCESRSEFFILYECKLFPRRLNTSRFWMAKQQLNIWIS